MTADRLFRLSGFALLLALPFQIVGFMLHPPSEQVADVLNPLYGPAHLIIFASWFLAVLGLPGLYAKQAGRMGVFGLVGFCATMLAASYHLYLLLYEAYATPLLAETPATQALIGDGPLGHGAGALGPLAFALILAFPLFGVAMLRGGVLPRGAGWLQILSFPVLMVGALVLPPDAPAPLGTMGTTPIALMYYLLFAGYAWGGYALWTGKERLQPSAKRVPQTVANS